MALNYTSVEKMYSTLPALNSLSTLSSKDMCTFATDAEALVDAKLSKAYSVPVPGAPPLLSMLATDISVYRVLSRRVYAQEQASSVGQRVSSPWLDRYKEALQLLDELAKGELQLTTASGSVISAATGESMLPWSNTKAFIPTFNELPPEVQAVDEEKQG